MHRILPRYNLYKNFKFARANFNTNQYFLQHDGVFTSFDVNGDVFFLFNNNYSLEVSLGGNPVPGKDFYEPRIRGRYLATWRSINGAMNGSTNYNKAIAFDFGCRFTDMTSIDFRSRGYYINPIIRFSDKWSMKLSYSWDKYGNDRGFANFDENFNPIFGQRDITTVENTVTTRYLFKNDMALSITARHYWSRGEYKQYFNLLENGSLSPTNTYPGINDFNTNFFNVDMSYSWQFSPGSSLIVTYKNQILRDPYPVSSTELGYDYKRNLDLVLNNPQTNSLSLKVLYYLDYQYFKK